jgi:hypothetical protein
VLVPAWYAVMAQMPTGTVVTVESETTHTLGDSERNDTTRGLSASVEADNVTGRPTASPRNARSLDQRTVEREVTLPASLLRSRTLPIGCRPMTALPASSQNVLNRNQSVIREVSRHAPADTWPGRRRISLAFRAGK